jgi:hypothetical protein
MRNLVLEETLAGCFRKLRAYSGNLTKSLEVYFWILCLFLTLKTFWQALENDRHWGMVEPENGRCRRMVGAGKWQALENGRRWRMVGAGEWQALGNGRRWRMVGAGEW